MKGNFKAVRLQMLDVCQISRALAAVGGVLRVSWFVRDSIWTVPNFEAIRQRGRPCVVAGAAVKRNSGSARERLNMFVRHCKVLSEVSPKGEYPPELRWTKKSRSCRQLTR